MHKTLLSFLIGTSLSAGALAQGLRPLDDAELSKVSGRDGIGIVMDLHLNEATMTDATAESRISLGFKDTSGTTSYLVIKNPRGVLGVFGISIDVKKRSDGGPDYVAVGLPGNVFLKDVGFESLSAQQDPSVPVPFNQSLGGLSVTGKMSMTGELRLWAH